MALHATIVLVTLGLLYKRVLRNGKKIWNHEGLSAVEGFIIFTLFFGIASIIRCSLLAMDVAGPATIREILFEIILQFGFMAVVCYVAGIIKAIPINMLRMQGIQVWFPSATVVNRLSLAMVLISVVTNITAAYLSGFFHLNGNPIARDIWILLHFLCWSCISIFVAGEFYYVSQKLSVALKHGIIAKEASQSPTKASALKASTRKMDRLSRTLYIFLLSFAIVMFSFGFMPKIIFSTRHVSRFFSVTVNIVPPLLYLIALCIIATGHKNQN